MKSIQYSIFLLVFLTTNTLYAHDAAKEVIPIDHVIEKYSEIHGTKFVLDPRVKAKVNLVGLSLNELTQTNLMDILLIHSFTAYEKDGVVYVLPRAAADYISSEIGEIWGSQ